MKGLGEGLGHLGKGLPTRRKPTRQGISFLKKWLQKYYFFVD